jgi:2-heptyl-3-hydroxy-4(1H)-quinolone synthase
VFDAVIAADGTHSSLRAVAFTSYASRHVGYTSWCFHTENVVGLEHPVEMWGAGKRFGLIPVANNEICAFTTFQSRDGDVDALSGRLERLRNTYREFGGVIPALLAHLERDDQVFHADIAEVTASRWVASRLALLGDAAHAITPNLGQGAGVAMVDAVVLARALAEYNDVPAALAEYQRLRQREVNRIRLETRALGWVGQWSFEPLVAWRNASMRLMPESLALRLIAHLLRLERPGF